MKSFLQFGIILFVVVNVLIYALKTSLIGWNIPPRALVYGNAWLFGVTLLAFYFESKGVLAADSYAFFRYIYTGMLLKLFLSVGAFVVFVFTDRSAITKGVVLLWLLLYMVYTGIEVSRLTRAGKAK
jgi:hypothetical protein